MVNSIVFSYFTSLSNFLITHLSFQSCFWRSFGRSNSSSVSATFSAVVSASSAEILYLNVGGIVKLLGGLLGPACSSANPNCQSTSLKAPAASVITAAPLQPALPTVVLIAPQVSSACANLTLDATGSYGNGGRLYTAG